MLLPFVLSLAILSAPTYAIVGGTDVTNPIPYMAVVYSSGWYGDEAACDGIIIGTKSVLTTASCVDGKSASQLKVKFGGLDRRTLERTVSVSAIYLHESYNSDTLDKNYAVLVLEHSHATQPANLPTSASNLNGTPARVVGWGKTSGSAQQQPYQLQEAEMTFVDHDVCKEKWKDYKPITDELGCIESKSASVCQGDSGGPVLSEDGNLVGMISAGDTNCPADSTILPNLFTDLFAAREWIESHTW